jgi:2-hydroxymuconate-semialdehyde hydrolase
VQGAETTMAATLLTPDELASITVPVTMLHGRDDVAFPPGITLTLAESLPQANVVLLSRCSHSVALEHSAQVLAQLRLLMS